MKVFLLVTVVALALAGPSPAFRPRMFPHGRIIGGKEIDISEVPWQVSLQYKGQHICGASVLSPMFVVTAAHCTDGASADDLSVRVGSSIREDGGQVVDVSIINQHPLYDRITVNYDISVLELAAPLLFNPKVAPVDVPTISDSWEAGTDMLVTGWGLTNPDGDDLPVNLMGVNIQVVDRAKCDAAYGKGSITDKMMCATADGKDSCQGDSGGPLAVDGVLAGIVSWGYGCAQPGFPGVYTFVPSVRDFIMLTAGV